MTESAAASCFGTRATWAGRDAIVAAGRRLYEQGLVTANEGNISIRIDDGQLVTAGGLHKGLLTPEDVLRVDQDGRPREPGRNVSSEIRMHAAIYARRPDVAAIVHAHPPAATAFAVAHLVPDERILPEAVLLLGSIGLVGYAPPSTAELAAAVAEGLAGRDVVLLANHGAVTVGRTLAQSLERMETLEHLARVELMGRLLGQPHPLSSQDVERLLQLPTAPYK